MWMLFWQLPLQHSLEAGASFSSIMLPDTLQKHDQGFKVLIWLCKPYKFPSNEYPWDVLEKAVWSSQLTWLKESDGNILVPDSTGNLQIWWYHVLTGLGSIKRTYTILGRWFYSYGWSVYTCSWGSVHFPYPLPVRSYKEACNSIKYRGILIFVYCSQDEKALQLFIP